MNFSNIRDLLVGAVAAIGRLFASRAPEEPPPPQPSAPPQKPAFDDIDREIDAEIEKRKAPGSP